MPKVTFLPSNTVVEAKVGETLLDLALAAGVSIQHACGGFCACTTCHCEISEGADHLVKAEEDELERLEVLDDRRPTSRLACQSKVQGDVVVNVINHE